MRDGDYFGTAVNRSARVMAIAHGGQVVCTGTTAGLVGDRLPAGVRLLDLGPHRLRDLSWPEQIHQVVVPELRQDFPRLRSLDALPGNLPIQPTAFVGREREVKELAEAILSARIVTLTGVGGVGKTRLALQAAAEVATSFGDGAWLVELAGVGQRGCGERSGDVRSRTAQRVDCCGGRTLGPSAFQGDSPRPGQL